MKHLIANLSMTKKLLVSPLVVLVSMVVLVVMAYVGFSSQSSAIDELYNNRFVGYQSCAKIINDVSVVHKNLYKVVSLAGSNADEKIIDGLVKEQLKILAETQQFAEGLAKRENLTPEEKTLLETALGQFKPYREQAAKVLDMAMADYSVALTFMGPVDGKFQAMYKALSELQSLEDRLGRENHGASKAGFSALMRNFILVAAVVVIFSIAVSLLITRMISSRLTETMEVLRHVAEGDLTHEVASASADELGQLAQSVNTMRVKMGEAVGHSKEIAQNLSESASEQAATLEETAASLDELESMTRQNAGNTGEANRLMTAANEIMEKANRSMVQLAASTQQIAEASRQTQNIVKSIDEIAFQTNLLALNAAVEAARAGEAGAGFAVVANEVRNLALRATESARNTSELIDDIVSKVHDGERLSQATRNDFNEVTSAASKVVALMAEIAAASQEQSQGIGQINKAVNEMSQVTQKNAAAAEELASTMSMFRTEGRMAEGLRLDDENRA
jgi:methyl-accepting chemotaxis protein